MARPQDDHLWALAHAERAALAKVSMKRPAPVAARKPVG